MEDSSNQSSDQFTQLQKPSNIPKNTGKTQKPKVYSGESKLLGSEPEFNAKQSLFSLLNSLEKKYRNPKISDEELAVVKKEIGTLGIEFLKNDDLFSYISQALIELEEIEKKRKEEQIEESSFDLPQKFRWKNYDRSLIEEREATESSPRASSRRTFTTKPPHTASSVISTCEPTLRIDWTNDEDPLRTTHKTKKTAITSRRRT